jgi:hypothetical protein
MPELRIYNIFISHAWAYNDDYYRLIEMLNAAPNFDYHNFSVPEHDPLHAGNRRQLEEDLYDQIRPSSIVIILAGMYVPHHDWIQREIDMAQVIDKPILGIAPWGSQVVPVAIQNAADEIVGWNTDSIVGAIRRLSL